MNDYPLSNDTQSKSEDLYQSLPRVSDIAKEVPQTEPLAERSSRFSSPEAFPTAEKPVEPQDRPTSFDSVEKDRPTLAHEFAPLRPTPASVHRTEPTSTPSNPTAAPTRPTPSAYASNPIPTPTRPTPSAYTSNPIPAPTRPTPSAYASNPIPAPTRPTPSAYTSNPTPAPVRPAPVREKPVKKKRMGLRIALIALCCALLGSVLGGGIVGYYFEHHKTENSAEATEATQPPVQQTPPSSSSASSIISQPATTLAQLYNNAVPSIVGITNEFTTYDYFGQPTAAGATGTGFIISADGEILTNYHVVENAEKLTVTLYDGTEYSAKLLGYEAESDVALLKVEAENLPAVKLGDSDAIYVGEQIAAIGNPLGELTYTMTVGYVSAKGRAVYTDEMPINMMQIDAAINSGNSGGPLFNLAGEVVGITTAKYSGSIGGSANVEGIGFAIPINDVLSILDDLREYGSVKNRAYIGVTVTNSQAGGDIPAGALVQSIEKNSSGDKAGLRVSDIIIKVGDKKVTGIDTLYQALRPYRAGDTVEITVFRSGDEKTLSITFDAMPGSETEDPQIPTEDFDFPWG